MYLNDFKEAIEAMEKHSGWSCFSLIQISAFGDRFIFLPYRINDFFFVYFINNGKIVMQYSDTWKNPEHKTVIYKGNK